jgi:hypothetical protein
MTFNFEFRIWRFTFNIVLKVTYNNKKGIAV